MYWKVIGGIWTVCINPDKGYGGVLDKRYKNVLLVAIPPELAIPVECHLYFPLYNLHLSYICFSTFNLLSKARSSTAGHGRLIRISIFAQAGYNSVMKHTWQHPPFCQAATSSFIPLKVKCLKVMVAFSNRNIGYKCFFHHWMYHPRQKGHNGIILQSDII